VNGNWGVALMVDLGTSEVTLREIPEQWFHDYIGGEGVAMRLFAELVDFDGLPLEPSQPLIVAVGPLTGTAAPSSGRTCFVFRSPASGAIGASNVGGHLSPAIKKAGYDLIVFTGQAEKPVYVVIDDDTVEVRDATELWSTGVHDTDSAIRDTLDGKGWQLAVIGPAGENSVLYAAIMTDRERAAGRGGSGAAMGAKGLKAFAIRGTKPLPIAVPDALKETARVARTEFLNEAFVKDELKPYGTPSFYDAINALGVLPTQNWRRTTFDESIDTLGMKAYHETLDVKPYACAGCPVACGRVTTIKSGPYAGETGGGPEYETIGAFGSKCLVNDLEAVTHAGHLCNDLGLDTIAAGQTIAVAMEWYERGILTPDTTGGLELTWGNGAVLPALLGRIAHRTEGIGNLLADGTKRAASALGGDAADYTFEVKGVELASCGVRASKSEGLSHAVSPRGADHLRPFASTIDAFGYRSEELGITRDVDYLADSPQEWVKPLMELSMATNLLGVCLFSVITLAVQPSSWAAVLSAATGEVWSKDDLLKAAERVINLERLVNARFGLTRADDTLPKRITNEPASDGRGAGQVADLVAALDSFYESMGWDLKSGLPTDRTVEELGLAGIV